MERQDERSEGAARRNSHEWVRLIRKLRWIGRDDDAKRLEEMVIGALPAEQRATVSFAPFSTD